MNHSTTGFPVHHQLLEFTQTHVHRGEGNGTLLQYCCLENPMDGGAWCAAVHGVEKSRKRLSDFLEFTFHFHALEKEMATHSSVLTWRIPGMGEPGGLPSVGSHRVGHDWSDLAAAAGNLRSCKLREHGPAKCMTMPRIGEENRRQELSYTADPSCEKGDELSNL